MTPTSKLLGLSAALLLGACAGLPPAPSTAVAPPTVVTTGCVRNTGTRIQLPEGACVGMAGRVVTREQIDQTGAMSPGQALRLLGVY